MWCISVAHPGFPVGGGVDLVGGDVDSRGSYVSRKFCMCKRKNLDRGGERAPGTPPRFSNVFTQVSYK